MFFIHAAAIVNKNNFFRFSPRVQLNVGLSQIKAGHAKANIMPIKSKLKYAREFLGKTQAEMGEAVGKTKQGWQTYERGISVPGGNVFQALCDLGFNPGWFFSDDVPMLLRENSERPPAIKNTADASPLPSDNLGLGESVELLAKIYNSGNKVLIRAIAANLNAFGEAIDNKALAQKAIDMMDEMNKRMLALEEDLAKLKSENEELKTREPAHDRQQATG